MNDYLLDSTSGKNLVPRRLEQEASKKTGSPSNPKVSFHNTLQEAVQEGTASHEVRQDLVRKYKVSLANGTYEVKAQELAEKMIQKIRENKSRETP